MANNSQTTSPDQAVDTCPICNISVRSEDLAFHLEKAHPDKPVDVSQETEAKENYWDLPESSNNKSTRKRADVRKEMEQEKQKKLMIYGLVGIFIIIMVTVGGFLAYSLTSSPEDNENGGDFPNVGGEVTPDENNEVRISVSSVNDGKAHYYSYDNDGIEIKFFVLKSSDSVIRAAFDACDVCYLEKKGYYQDGDEMVCRNCGLRFPSVKINVIKGGCNPAPLERNLDGNELVITLEDIEAGKRYF